MNMKLCAVLIFAFANICQAQTICPSFNGELFSFSLPDSAKKVMFKQAGDRASVAFSLKASMLEKWLKQCAPQREMLHDAATEIQETEYPAGFIVIFSPTRTASVCVEIIRGQPSTKDMKSACKL